MQSTQDGKRLGIIARLNASRRRYLNAIELYAASIAHGTSDDIEHYSNQMNFHRERVGIWAQRLAECE